MRPGPSTKANAPQPGSRGVGRIISGSGDARTGLHSVLEERRRVATPLLAVQCPIRFEVEHLMKRPLCHSAVVLLALVAACTPAPVQMPAPAPSVAVSSPATAATATAGTTVVYLVRHAEKAVEPGSDPRLSEAGKARAQALAATLADSGVQLILVTPYRRTRDTAEPLADKQLITLTSVNTEGGTPVHVAGVAGVVKENLGKRILVVGHSNTVMGIIAALGGPKLPDLCDGQYAVFHTVTIPAAGTPVLRVSSYGAPDPAGAANCPRTMK